MVTRLALFVCIVAFALQAAAVQAQSLQASVEQQLTAQGYRDIDMSRTLLGRARFEARKGDMTRVIVVNPNTGEVLRDISRSSGGAKGGSLVDILDGAIFGGDGADGDDGGDSDGGDSDGGDSDGGDGDGGDGDGDGDGGDGDGGDGDGGDGDGGDGDGGDGD